MGEASRRSPGDRRCAEERVRLGEHAGGDRPALGVVGVEQSRAAAVTAASFQPRLKASWMPVFMPCPPAGEWTCAASPASNTRPTR